MKDGGLGRDEGVAALLAEEWRPRRTRLPWGRLRRGRGPEAGSGDVVAAIAGPRAGPAERERVAAALAAADDAADMADAVWRAARVRLASLPRRPLFRPGEWIALTAALACAAGAGAALPPHFAAWLAAWPGTVWGLVQAWPKGLTEACTWSSVGVAVAAAALWRGAHGDR